MSNDDEGVGYRRPPKHSQFKPGRSGNPQGRKPQFGGFQADLLTELSEETSIRENGIERKVSKQRAVINALVTAAIEGNVRAASALLAICARPLSTQTESDQHFISEADDQILRNFGRRQRRSPKALNPTKRKEEER